MSKNMAEGVNFFAPYPKGLENFDSFLNEIFAL